MSDEARRGRPAKFDRDEVIGRLLVLFWEKGYDATTHRDMREVSGMSGSSLANAFGDKAATFDAVLARYHQMSEVLIGPLVDNSGGVEAILEWLDFLSTAIAAKSGPPGCLMVSSMSQPVGSTAAVRDRTTEFMCRVREAIELALERSVALNEMASDKVTPRRSLLESSYIGIMTAARTDVALAVSMIDGVRDTVETWAS